MRLAALRLEYRNPRGPAGQRANPALHKVRYLSDRTGTSNPSTSDVALSLQAGLDVGTVMERLFVPQILGPVQTYAACSVLVMGGGVGG